MESVYIEITDACNLQCSFCPCGTRNRGDKAGQMPRTFMQTELFEKCIAGAQEIGAKNVFFHVLGEPTLHPGFAHYLKKLEQTPLKLTLTTNGTTISRTGRHILDCPAVRQVNFSTHAFAELDRTVAENHLRDVLDFCRMALAVRPDMYINLRLWNIGDATAGDWNSYAISRINETFDTQVAPGNFCSRHKSFPVTGRLYIHEDSRFEWPARHTESEQRETSVSMDTLVPSAHRCDAGKYPAGTCHALETHAAILHDGRVVACCLDYSGQITLGNIADQGLAEILGSSAARNIREGFEKHELRHPFCQKCSFCKRFDK
jgi:radical SAM protein with 4Fe4S-binding SPASM domain